MNNKRYEDYHVLDEKTDDLDLEQINDQILSKSVEIEHKVNNNAEQEVEVEVIHDPEFNGQMQEIIDVEVIGETKKDSGYTSVLEDIEDEEILNPISQSIDRQEELVETQAQIDSEMMLESDQTQIEKEIAAEKNQAQVVVYKSILTEEDEEQESSENLQSPYNEEEQKGNNAGDYKEDNYNKENYKAGMHQQADYSRQSQEFNNQESRDTSFSSYVEADKKRERSFFVKWGIRLAKLILLIMLLPVIGVVGGGVLFVAGGILLGILGCIGGGIFILGATCFIATQVNTTIIALGISTGITAIAFGGIVLVICMMCIAKINQLMGRHKLNKKNKEVR